MNDQIEKLKEVMAIDSQIDAMYAEAHAKLEPSLEAKALIEVVKKTKETADELESEAKSNVIQFGKLKAFYKKNQEKVSMLAKIDIDSLDDDKLAKLKAYLEKMLDNLSGIESKLKELNTNIERILKDFDKAKKDANKAREEYRKLTLSSMGEGRKKLSNLKRKRTMILNTIDDRLLEAMQYLHDNAIDNPVVEIVEPICTICNELISKKALKVMFEFDYSRCNNCGRIIYTDALKAA